MTSGRCPDQVGSVRPAPGATSTPGAFHFGPDSPRRPGNGRGRGRGRAGAGGGRGGAGGDRGGAGRRRGGTGGGRGGTGGRRGGAGGRRGRAGAGSRLLCLGFHEVLRHVLRLLARGRLEHRLAGDGDGGLVLLR